uniref:(California timema) hypothetical protein n=1 Tax=Timema californicum TaxID=61474 RepID=A0A7R9J551_TIMCA|nr:unnamed protein product [Timema californicum]
MDTLSEKLETRLHLGSTKIVGEERIKKALDEGEDVAILTTFLSDTEKGFQCTLKERCLYGDPKTAILVRPTEIRTSISPSSAAYINMKPAR